MVFYNLDEARGTSKNLTHGRYIFNRRLQSKQYFLSISDIWYTPWCLILENGHDFSEWKNKSTTTQIHKHSLCQILPSHRARIWISCFLYYNICGDPVVGWRFDQASSLASAVIIKITTKTGMDEQRPCTVNLKRTGADTSIKIPLLGWRSYAEDETETNDIAALLR